MERTFPQGLVGFSVGRQNRSKTIRVVLIIVYYSVRGCTQNDVEGKGRETQGDRDELKEVTDQTE